MKIILHQQFSPKGQIRLIHSKTKNSLLLSQESSQTLNLQKHCSIQTHTNHMALVLKQGHNQRAFLEKQEGWSQYDEIIDLVVKSQYFTALTIDPPIHPETLNEF